MVTLAVIATEAHAQAADRSGFLLGISLPLGGKLVRQNNVSGDESLLILADGGRDLFSLGGEVQLGGVLSRRVAALATLAFDFGVEGSAPETPDIAASLRVNGRTVDIMADDHSTNSSILAGNIQYWLTDGLWIRGGVGAASLDRTLTETRTGITLTVDKGFSPAVTAGVGVSIGALIRVPAELQFRYSTYSVDGMRVHIATALFGSMLR